MTNVYSKTDAIFKVCILKCFPFCEQDPIHSNLQENPGVYFTQWFWFGWFHGRVKPVIWHNTAYSTNYSVLYYSARCLDSQLFYLMLFCSSWSGNMRFKLFFCFFFCHPSKWGWKRIHKCWNEKVPELETFILKWV